LLIRIIYLFDFETSWIAKNLDSRRCHEYVCDRFNPAVMTGIALRAL